MGAVLRRVVNRGEVHLVDLDPTRGREIRKTRPCLVVSPDEMNHHLRTVLVAPMTTGGLAYPSRVPCTFRRVVGHVALDQLRTVDTARLVKRLGVLDALMVVAALAVLREMFSD